MKVKFKRGIKRGYPVYVHGRQGVEKAFFPTKEDGRYCIDDFYFDSDGKSKHNNIYLYCKIPFMYSNICKNLFKFIFIGAISYILNFNLLSDILNFNLLSDFLIFLIALFILISWSLLYEFWQSTSLNNHIKKLK